MMQTRNKDVVQRNVERCVTTTSAQNVENEKQNIKKRLQKNINVELIIVNDTKKIESNLSCDDKTSH